MISQLELTRFQGFANTATVPLRPITLIFGPNASGKSSIIRSLLLAKQSLFVDRFSFMRRIGFNYEGEAISLASFANVVYKHDENSSFKIAFEIDNITELMPVRSMFLNKNRSSKNANPASKIRTDVEEKVKKIGVSWKVTKSNFFDQLTVHFFFSEKEPLSLVFDLEDHKDLNSGKANYRLSISGIENLVGAIQEVISENSQEELLLRAIFSESPFKFPDDGLVSSKTINDQINDELKNIDELIGKLSFAMSGNWMKASIESQKSFVIGQYIGMLLSFAQDVSNRSLLRVRHVGPLREISKRLTYDAGSITEVDFDDDSAIRPVENEVSNWLLKLTEGRYQLSPVEFYASKVRFLGALRSQILIDNHTGTPVTFQDVGVGLSQLLPILELLSSAAAGRGQTLLIEQPELHLHPKMQANLADLFIDFIAADPNARAIISETHSESMLLRIQKRIRERTLDPNLVQIIYVDRTLASDTGAHSEGNFAFPLPIDENGDFIMPMPNSFNSQRFQDLL